MVPLNPSAFVILTGNGLTVSEDLARRFISVDFDPRTEDPEARPFTTDIQAEVTARRPALLAALLTIWRWGRIERNIPAGLPLGSFTQWCRWVRDPLVALGCQDPAQRVSEAKERDGRRQAIVDLFTIWWEKHQDRPVAAKRLHEDVKHAVDPQGRSRQHLTSQLENCPARGWRASCSLGRHPLGNGALPLTHSSGQFGARTIGIIGGMGPPTNHKSAPMIPMVPMTPPGPQEIAPARIRKMLRWTLWALCLRQVRSIKPRVRIASGAPLTGGMGTKGPAAKSWCMIKTRLKK